MDSISKLMLDPVCSGTGSKEKAPKLKQMLPNSRLTLVLATELHTKVSGSFPGFNCLMLLLFRNGIIIQS